jgi:hypothetical protein
VAGGDRQKAIAEAQDRLSKGDPNADPERTLDKALELLRSGKRIEGSTYQVELAPQEHELLDWDKPPSQQSEAVKAALYNDPQTRKVIGEADAGTGMAEFHNGLVDLALRYDGNPVNELFRANGGNQKKAASDYLRSLGIRGIKYLDQASRGTGDLAVAKQGGNMPLRKGRTQQVIEANTRDLVKTGLPQTKARQVALRLARKSNPPKKQ